MVSSPKQNNYRSWTVTFQNADYRLPLLSCSYNSAKNNALTLQAEKAEKAENGENSEITEGNQMDSTSIKIGNQLVIISTFYSFYQVIHGSFSVTLGGQTITVRSDISAEDLGSALESIQTISDVGVVRVPNGMDGGYVWTITFYKGNILTILIISLVLSLIHTMTLSRYLYPTYFVFLLLGSVFFSICKLFYF